MVKIAGKEMKMNPTSELHIDALLPAEMAARGEQVGVNKAALPFFTTFMLAALAGTFIGLGAMFATTTAAGLSELPYGLARLLVGLVFCLGLILVIVGGAELFTGNNLIVMAWASRKISTFSLLRNWAIVYLGNVWGSVGIAVIVLWSKHYYFGGGAIGKTALSIARAKVNLGFFEAIALGVLCNLLVCLAVWMSFSARSTIDRIACIIFPIAAFVAAGFEHCVANMYFIPIGWMIKVFDPSFAQTAGLDLSTLTIGRFLFANLLPVTIGNVIGGSLMVGIFYWSIFLRRHEK